MTLVLAVLALVVVVNCCFMTYLIADVTTYSARAENERGNFLGIGVISFFQFLLSTFGISDFAIGAAVYSKLKWVSAKKLPGTVNAAAVIPVAVMALFYITSIEIDLVTLAVPIIAQMAGAYLSVRFVVKMPARPIRIFLSLGMLVTVLRVAAENFGFFPAGGTVAALGAGRLSLLGCLCLLYGALNNLGLGSYAPTMATVYALGLNPGAAFPIMMGSAAFSVPVAGIQFIKHDSYSRKITIITSIFGTMGVLAAAFIFNKLDFSLLKWLVAGFLFYSACSMLLSALKNSEDSDAAQSAPKKEKTGKRLSATGRLTSFCLAMILVCTVSLILIFVRNFQLIVSSNYVKMSISEHNIRLRDNVQSYLQGHEIFLLGARAGVSHFMSEEPVDLERLRLYLEKTSRILEDVSTLYCTTNEVWNRPGGYAVFSQPWDVPPDWNNTERPWFIAAKKTRRDSVAYSKPYVDALTGDIILDMSINVIDEKGKDIGVVSESITIESLNAMLRQAASLEDQQTFLIDSDGLFVTHPDKRMAARGNFFSETGLEGYRGDILSADIFSAADNDMTVYSSSIPAADWFVVSMIPTEKIFSSINNDILDLFLIPMLIIIFMLLVVLISLMIIIRGETRAKLTAERITKEKDSFIARVSHEIRTPMNAVIGMSELAQRDYGTPKGLEYISGIKNAGTSLLAIINDILDFSKIESGRLELAAANYETASLINDVLTIIRVRMAEKPLELILNMDPGIPGRMTGDAGRVKQVLLNLLSNAVKYTDKGFIRFSFSGELMENDAIRLTFVVEDSGIGIKQEDMPVLFGDFARIDEKRNSTIEGTGLGLSISRSLCSAMGGDITASSEYGKGSVFTASMIQTVADRGPMGDVTAASVTRAGKQRVTFTAPEARVLVVDDFSSNLMVAEGLLAPYKMLVFTSLNGRDAVEMIKARSFDLVLMDHMMPEMDGMEATNAIRKLGGRFAELPIAALTANAVSGMKEMFLSGGFNDFLSKPIETDKLDELLQRWIPEAKRQSAPAEAGIAPEDIGAAESPPEIEGVDTAAGMAKVGGSAAVYRELLEMFLLDAEDNFAPLETIPEEANLKSFITCVHGLKSGLGNIGANALSEFAALLEKAGRDGDMGVIRDNLAPFREELTALMSRIGGSGKAGDTDREDSDPPETRDVLTELSEALDAMDEDAADAALAKLQNLPLNRETHAAITDIAKHVLFGDFKKASEGVNTLLEPR